MVDTNRAGTYTQTSEKYVSQITWTLLDGDDTGTPVKVCNISDKCVQIYGTFGGSTVTIEGSNDTRADPSDADHANAQYATLNDLAGVAISKTATAMSQILENPLWIRPKTAGGTGASITVVIIGNKNAR